MNQNDRKEFDIIHSKIDNIQKDIETLKNEMSDAHNKTDDAAAHITFQLNLSLLDAIHVPRVCTESFAITE